MRIGQVTLGYTLPKALLQNVGIQKLRVYATDRMRMSLRAIQVRTRKVAVTSMNRCRGRICLV